MIRKIKPTIVAVDIMIIAERIISLNPNSFIITANVAIHGKNIVSIVAMITSCIAVNVPIGKLKRVPTARSFLKKPLISTTDVSPGKPNKVDIIGWKIVAIKLITPKV